MSRVAIWFFLSAFGVVAATAAAVIQASSAPGAGRLVEVRVEGFGPTQTDRCPTCHAVAPGEEYPEGHPEVPGFHPVERFGCASCHGGEPRAVVREWAHIRGREPLLHLASDGTERPERLEAGCARCHILRAPEGVTYDEVLVPHVSRGRELFVRRACWGCHRLSDISFGERGPDLSDVGARLAGDDIYVSIEDPSASPSSTTMPRLRLPEEELRDLVTFLLAQVDADREAALSTSRIIASRTPGSPPPRPPVNEGQAQGAHIMANMGCVGCHRLDMHDGLVGPDLRWEGELRGPGYLRDMITRPASTVIGSRMPPFDLGGSEVEAVEEYLARQSDVAPRDEETAWAEICARCHGLDGRGRTAAAPYLARRPRDLSNEQFYRGASAERLSEALTNGVPGTPMAPWASAIPAFRGRRVVTFLGRKLHGGKIAPAPRLPVPPRPPETDPTDTRTAEHLFEVECSQCHGPNGWGDGVEALGLRPRPRDLTNGAFIQSLSDHRMYRSITYGVPGSKMPGHLAGYSTGVMWEMTTKVRTLAGEPLAGVYPEDHWPWQRHSRRRRRGRKVGKRPRGRRPARKRLPAKHPPTKRPKNIRTPRPDVP